MRESASWNAALRVHTDLISAYYARGAKADRFLKGEDAGGRVGGKESRYRLRAYTTGELPCAAVPLSCVLSAVCAALHGFIGGRDALPHFSVVADAHGPARARANITHRDRYGSAYYIRTLRYSHSVLGQRGWMRMSRREFRRWTAAAARLG